ncbi:JAB domain-containing protein [Chryseobacterium taklimakanense]|uniref:DNA repair protein n=1 Tax=Chryseobacterium taklimakanense TaxID=536441 RepID=A0A3G8WHR8_9FLAO|nr:JAB domain-containing protein [Chryseobacterium taklimakanense]AZI20730.1 DNA repair protein [Chryseobacterium taklimakanense]
MENIIDEIQISYTTRNKDKKKIVNSSDAFECLLENWNKGTIELFEEFKVLLLNNANEILGIYNVSKGGIASTVVEIKHILFIALKTNSSSIILAHNHPSGNLQPSSYDINFTKRINDACKLMDLKLSDHIIITLDNYFSFADEALL